MGMIWIMRSVEKEQTGWLNHDSSMVSRSGLGGGERIEGLEGMA